MKKDNGTAADVKTAAPAADQRADEAAPARNLFLPPEMWGAAGKPPARRQTLLERFHGLLRWLGEVQGGILIGISVLYVFGYLNWSIYAAENNLGVLPVVEAQYLVTGFLNALIIALYVSLVLAANWFINKLKKELPAWLLDLTVEASGWRLWLRRILLSLFVLSFVVMAFGPRSMSPVSMIIFLTLMSLGILSQAPEPGGGREAGFKRYFTYYMLTFVILSGLALVVYGVNFYSGFPQTLGGFQPRCMLLDLDPAQVSAETLNVLAPAQQLPQAGQAETTARPRVVRSKPVQVLFAGGGSFILRADDRKVYEVEKAVVKSASSCKAGPRLESFP